MIVNGFRIEKIVFSRKSKRGNGVVREKAYLVYSKNGGSFKIFKNLKLAKSFAKSR